MWKKSTYSGGNGNCVEVNRATNAIRVRDTKDRSGAVLTFTQAEWTAFVKGVKDGQFG